MASIRARRRSDGTVAFTVLWREGTTQRSKAAKDQRTAEQLKALIEVHGRLPVTPAAAGARQTVSDAVDRHLTQLTGVQVDTRDRYRRQAATHLQPLLPLAIDAVDRDVVAAWVNSLEAAGKSPKTIANVHGLLSAVMTTAVRTGWIPVNPCRGVRLPRASHDRQEMVFLSSSEYELLLEHLDPHWRSLARFLAGTGCRFSEATALAVRDVDVLAAPPLAAITKAWKRGQVMGAPKTRRSRRTISLGRDLVDDLLPLLAGRGDDELLFTTPAGAPVAHQRFWDAWQSAVDRATSSELGAVRLRRRPRIHDLRHTHASWLIAAGVPLPVIQRRLGHESITTTVDVYGHLDRSADAAAAEAVDRAMRGSAPAQAPGSPLVADAS